MTRPSELRNCLRVDAFVMAGLVPSRASKKKNTLGIRHILLGCPDTSAWNPPSPKPLPDPKSSPGGQWGELRP